MKLLPGIKNFFSPEERIIRHLTKAQEIAWRSNYSVLPGVLTEAITQFDERIKNKGDDPRWCSKTANDDDLRGIYDYLMWSAKSSGWSSYKLHHIQELYRKANFKEVVNEL